MTTNRLLTPITLWKDFDDTLPLDPEVTFVSESEGIKHYSIRISGRDTGMGRVRIFAHYARPAKEGAVPTLLFFRDFKTMFETKIAKRFIEMGYAVMIPDYLGESEGRENFTVYPENVAYANIEKSGRHLTHVDTEAYETTWYEWVGVGRYCVKYLKSREDVLKIGSIGFMHGGQILWQLMSFSPELDCGCTIFSPGWEAYREKLKFDEVSDGSSLDPERYRYIAGIESQAYAPYVKAPMLMISATNDEHYDSDRAYDTFARINPEYDSFINYSLGSNMMLGNRCLNNLDLFINKFLWERLVFMPKPLVIAIKTLDDGTLAAEVATDADGKVARCEVLFAENELKCRFRNWEYAPELAPDADGTRLFALNACVSAKIVFAFARVTYSSGFTVSSRIAIKRLTSPCSNFLPRSKIMYCSREGLGNFSVASCTKNQSIDNILSLSDKELRLIEGPCKIKGLYSPYGLKTRRMGDIRYCPENGSILKFDAFGCRESALKVAIEGLLPDGRILQFSAECKLTGGKYWQTVQLTENDFKTETGYPLREFSYGKSISFACDDEFAINNILWL